MYHPLIAASLWLLALAGCGPGLGGSGTGNGFTAFQASAAFVCSSEFASALDCLVYATSGPQGTIDQGTAVTHFADKASDATVSVAFRANAIELDAACPRLHFAGDWGISATNDARFFGTYTDEALREPLPASLQVQAVTNDLRNQLTVTVRDAEGRIVLGPVVLRRVDAPPTPARNC